MIAQEIFDQVVAHLGRQRARSIDHDTGLCLYRGPDGLKCAVGCLITDAEYTSEMDTLGSDVRDLQDGGLLPERLRDDVGLLSYLQEVHDYHDVSTWRAHLGAAARKFSLQWKPEVYGEY